MNATGITTNLREENKHLTDEITKLNKRLTTLTATVNSLKKELAAAKARHEEQSRANNWQAATLNAGEDLLQKHDEDWKKYLQIKWRDASNTP